MKHYLSLLLMLFALSAHSQDSQPLQLKKGDVIDGPVLVNGHAVMTKYKVWRNGSGGRWVRLGADEYGQPAVDTATVGRVVVPDSIIGPDGQRYHVWAIARQAFAHCRHLSEVVMPEGIAQIGDQSFLGCTALTELHLPSTVKIIYPCAFRDCSRLGIVTLGSRELPNVYSDIFDQHTIEHAMLFIPNGTTALYAESLVWGLFHHRLEMLE